MRYTMADWEIDDAAKQVRLRRFWWGRRIGEFVWPTRYRVCDLYTFIMQQGRHHMDRSEVMTSCDMAPASSVDLRYELDEDWGIPRADLKHLAGAHLTQKGKLLVPACRSSTIWRILKLSVVAILLAITSLGGFFQGVQLLREGIRWVCNLL